jgi:uncharacterized protein (DUF1330 family)
MPAYMIFIRDEPVRDAAEMAEYQRKNREQSGDRPYQLKPLVVYGDTVAVEGTAPDGVIMLEFPSVEEAQAWYNSPGYQAALPHRLNAADYRAFIVQGV